LIGHFNHMKIIREIFGRIWALWAALLFFGTMLIFFIPFLLFSYPKKEPLKTYRFISFSRIWMGVYLFLIGCPLRIKGRDHFTRGRNYIVLCNHNSFMDVPVSSPAIPGGNKTIAKVEISRTPLFGLLYTTGSVLVNRKSDSSRKESYNKMKQVLHMGLHMCIYPEGTRNTSNEPLKPFHNGAFRLAKDTGKAIIPALIFNTRKVLPAGKFFYGLPHPLQIHFLPAVEVGDNTADELRKKVFQIMSEYYVQHTG
jgi:1-acyl-sn-glycerol-3-phosphate acyltransferase